MKCEYVKRVYSELSAKYAHETEFLQAVESFLSEIEPVFEHHPEYEIESILERLVEPERIISFRVPWMDDHGKVQVNTGYRVQFNSVNGPYKGGLRFHPTVNQSILKFLGFEQIFKNALTGLPIGGGKGGSNFDPKGKSDREIMRFCQSFMTELSKYIGPDQDVPAGDIGIGAREIGYLYGQYKRLQGAKPGVLTGKPVTLGGSQIRTEATGYGLVYFLEEMLKDNDDCLKGKSVILSGSGNVAYYAAEKVDQLGGIVMGMSDSSSAIYDPNGLDLRVVKALKVDNNERLSQYTFYHPQAVVYPGSIWDMSIQADIALPCATQNEINLEQAHNLVANGIQYVAEGANMPTQTEAIHYFKEQGILFGPAKAANAGGVAVSALEMSQNALRLQWERQEVDDKLHTIMTNIFTTCAKTAQEYHCPKDYAKGADIASFIMIADKMMMEGIV